MAPKAAPKAAAPPPPPEQPPQQQGWPVWQPWNLFQPLGQALEQGFETGLDAVVGPANGDEFQSEVRKDKERKRKSKRAKEPKIPPINFERQVAEKASELAERMRREEAELEDNLRRRKEAAVDNYRNIVQSTLVQVGGLYAVSQACLLVIFVPQKCPTIIPCALPPLYDCSGNKLSVMSPALRDAALADPELMGGGCCTQSSVFDYPIYQPDGHLCSLKENLDWENCTAFNQSVIVINGATLLIMLAAQSFFWKREVWMINHLEEDNMVPYSSLPEQIKPYEDLRKQNTGYNRGAYAYATAVTIMVALNFAVSTYFLIKGDGVYNYNIGSRTTTGLLTNTMLVSTKIMGYFTYARLSKTQDWAISMFSVIPVSYNVVDENYKIHHAKQDENLDA